MDLYRELTGNPELLIKSWFQGYQQRVTASMSSPPKLYQRCTRNMERRLKIFQFFYNNNGLGETQVNSKIKWVYERSSFCKLIFVLL